MHEVKQIILQAISKIELKDGWDKDLSLMEKALLRGRSPVEMAGGLIASLDDKFIPHIVDVAKAIAKAVE